MRHRSLVIIYPTLFTEHLLCAEYESSKSDNWCVGAGGAQEGVEKNTAAFSDLSLHIYICIYIMHCQCVPICITQGQQQ